MDTRGHMGLPRSSDDSVSEYVIASSDIIERTPQGRSDLFALAYGKAGCGSNQVGQKLWNIIDDGDLRQLYQLLASRVRTTGATVTLFTPFLGADEVPPAVPQRVGAGSCSSASDLDSKKRGTDCPQDSPIRTPLRPGTSRPLRSAGVRGDEAGLTRLRLVQSGVYGRRHLSRS